MLRLIVSSHGKLAEELVESSYMIFGRQDGVFALEFDLDEDLNDIKEKFGDPRRTSIEVVENEILDEDLIDREDCVITVTKIGRAHV